MRRTGEEIEALAFEVWREVFVAQNEGAAGPRRHVRQHRFRGRANRRLRGAPLSRSPQEGDLVITAACCEILTLTGALAARGHTTVLAAQDEDGLVECYAEWTVVEGGYEVGERLRCYSIDDACAIDGLFAAARGLRATDDAATIRDADARHAAQRRGAPVKGCKKSKRPLPEDDRLRAPIGARWEDV